MIDKIIGNRCTGCTSCKSSCPVSAIKMRKNSEGFLFPVVDENICINCGICEKKCPILAEKIINYDEPIVYAAWNVDEQIRIESTSGGVFTALAKAFIEHGGSVVGATYDENFTIYHVIIKTISEIQRLRQSKYAQSNLKDVFGKIKKLLDQQKKVLFCGTPCQAVGLQYYLGKTYNNLYCCDFICRGVVSPEVYHKFLYDMGMKSFKLKKVHFKNKDYGWNNFSTKLLFENGLVYQKNRDEDFYMRGYLKHNLYLRPCCYQCMFKTIPRSSDISLGDFWGIGNYKKELDNNRGTSVVLVNSQKGKKLFEWAKKDLYTECRNLAEVLNGNTCLLNSAQEGEFRKYFFENIKKYNFEELIEKIDKKALHLSNKDKVLLILHQLKINLLRKKNE